VQLLSASTECIYWVPLVCAVPFFRSLPLISKKVKWYTKRSWLLPWRHAVTAVLSWRHFPVRSSITLSVLHCGTATSLTVTPRNEHGVQSKHSSNFALPYKTATAITIMRHLLCNEQSHSRYKYLQTSLEPRLRSPHVLCSGRPIVSVNHVTILFYCRRLKRSALWRHVDCKQLSVTNHKTSVYVNTAVRVWSRESPELWESGAVRVRSGESPELWESGAVRVRSCESPKLWESGAVRVRSCESPELWESGTVRVRSGESPELWESGAVRVRSCESPELWQSGSVRARNCDSPELWESRAMRVWSRESPEPWEPRTVTVRSCESPELWASGAVRVWSYESPELWESGAVRVLSSDRPGMWESRAVLVRSSGSPEQWQSGAVAVRSSDSPEQWQSGASRWYRFVIILPGGTTI